MQQELRWFSRGDSWYQAPHATLVETLVTVLLEISLPRQLQLTTLWSVPLRSELRSEVSSEPEQEKFIGAFNRWSHCNGLSPNKFNQFYINTFQLKGDSFRSATNSIISKYQNMSNINENDLGNLEKKLDWIALSVNKIEVSRILKLGFFNSSKLKECASFANEIEQEPEYHRQVGIIGEKARWNCPTACIFAVKLGSFDLSLRFMVIRGELAGISSGMARRDSLILGNSVVSGIVTNQNKQRYWPMRLQEWLGSGETPSSPQEMDPAGGTPWFSRTIMDDPRFRSWRWSPGN